LINVPNTKNLDLFRVSTNGEALGSLVSNLGGFVNWILSCPEEYLSELYQGGSKFTELISQDQIHVNPLHVFVKDCLIPNENSKVCIGTKTSDYKALYGAYCAWCEINNINAMSHKSYNILLLNLLKQQGWDISKKRTSIGFIIKGIEINISFFWRFNK
jgi:hypothetical protein